MTERHGLGVRASRALRDWPISVKVIGALALTLLPFGILAAVLGYENYRDVVAAHEATAAARLEIFPGARLTLTQASSIGLPLLMWLAALLIGWLIASRLIVQPLSRLRRAVEAYSRGDTSVRLGDQRFFSREVGALALAFDAMASDIARHEAEQQAALAEQQRLTREVHHRVKNNLQIVSSLLSIQSRDAATAEVAQAYAVVQLRVAALAVVHRWMYESGAPGGGGVDFRSLSTDLCAGLEQGLASSEDIGVSVVAQVEPMFVGQDTAVPLAFLITELVSVAARLAAPGRLDARLVAKAQDGVATLRVTAAAFAGADPLSGNPTRPTQRIITGMARQLRSPLVHDPETGSYVISFPLPHS